jgi:hypothetical protein
VGVGEGEGGQRRGEVFELGARAVQMSVMAGGGRVRGRGGRPVWLAGLAARVRACRCRPRAAAVAAFGAHVDEPVGGLDDVEVVLDDDHGVAVVAQAVEHAEQHLDVGEVQAGGGLVEDVEGAAGVALGARGPA